jgi:hypothetical protein
LQLRVPAADGADLVDAGNEEVVREIAGDRA